MRHILAILLATASAHAADPIATLQIKALTAQMRYTESEFIVLPGQPVKLVFENGDDLPHNLVICKPGTDVLAMTLKQMDNAEAALKRNWLPDDPAILFHTRMLNPHEADEITFTAPDKLGIYPFVCTFPGHAMTMKGNLKVQNAGGLLQDLSFKLYNGSWSKLPEFDALQPHREGKVEGNLIQLKFDDYKNEFGVVFTGKLIAPKPGNYTFFVTSDDGSRLSIDGQEIIEQDGIHPSGEPKQGKLKLTAGEHTYRLEYFQGGGNMELFAAWSGPGFSPTPLSKWAPEGWELASKKKTKRNEETTGMPLVVTTEPIVYRNFITDAGQRSIGVGYPGGFNLAWSAESMNLTLLWRGAFIDAARHWNSRGGGAQSPLGYDTQQPVGNLSPPLAILEKPDSAWPSYDKQQRFEGYTWKGYSLDAQRQPTFRYEWQGLRVEDSFAPKGNAVKGDGSLTRTVRITRTQPLAAGVHWLVAAGDVKPDKDGGYIVNNKLVVQIIGAGPPILRTNAGRQELLVPLPSTTDEAHWPFRYTWLP